jgi:hypothetical protein
MSFIDFTPFRNPGYLDDFLDPVVASARDYARTQAEKAKQQRELDFRREQERRLSERDDERYKMSIRRQDRLDKQAQDQADLANRRLVGSRTVENEKARQDREAKIRAAVAAGDYATAEGLGAYTEQDPTTGEVAHRQLFQRVPVGPAPTAPPKPADAVEGPRISADDAERADLSQSLDMEGEVTGARDARANLQQQDAAREFDVAANEDYNRRRGEYDAQQANPRVRIGDVETTQGDVRYAAGRTNAGDLDQQREAIKAQLDRAMTTGDPLLIHQVERRLRTLDTLRPAVASGAVSAKAAADEIEKSGIREDNRDLTEWGKQGQWRNNLDVQDRRNQRPQAPGPARSLEFQERKEKSSNLRKDIKSDVERWNAKTTQDAANEFPNIVKMLDSGNGKLQNQALITMMRLAQKDNRFSDADAKLAMNTGSGWLDQAESFFSRGGTGELGPGVVENARKAAVVLNQFYQQKRDAMNADAESYLNNPDYYDPKEAEQILRREFPGFGRYIDKKRGAAAPGGGTRTPAGGGNNVDAIYDEYMRRRGGR